jgi:hypothetical protein
MTTTKISEFSHEINLLPGQGTTADDAVLIFRELVEQIHKNPKLIVENIRITVSGKRWDES